MLNTKLKLTLGLAALAAATALAQTQTPRRRIHSAAVPPPTAFDQWAKDVKNPADWITWGADLRLRNEYLDNALTLSEAGARHEQDYFRFRERIWASFMPVTNLSANVRFAAEEREWMKPSNASQYGPRTGL